MTRTDLGARHRDEPTHTLLDTLAHRYTSADTTTRQTIDSLTRDATTADQAAAGLRDEAGVRAGLSPLVRQVEDTDRATTARREAVAAARAAAAEQAAHRARDDYHYCPPDPATDPASAADQHRYGVTRSCYAWSMGNRYSFTPDGLRSVELAGITAEEVYQALHAPPGHRLTRHLDDGESTVCGITTDGRYLMVGLHESIHEDCDWDIVGARDLHTDEKNVFDRYLRRQP